MMAQDRRNQLNDAAPVATNGSKHAHEYTSGELRAITSAIAAGARHVSERLTPVASQGVEGQADSRAILALLAFCYARQIYSSTEIESRSRHDAGFRQLWRGEIPDAAMLRRFRAENREALEMCLKAALRGLGEEKRAEGLIARVTEEQLVEDARRRMIMAMFIDGMEMNAEDTASL